jgi:hypothetical protein
MFLGALVILFVGKYMPYIIFKAIRGEFGLEIIIAAVGLATGIGLLMRREWARIMFIILTVVAICFSIFFVYAISTFGSRNGEPNILALLMAIPGIALYIAPIIFITRPSVKNVFR